MVDKAVAIDFFLQWRDFSVAFLKIVAPNCPSTPGVKVRPWEGTGPVGLGLHYTGGPNGVASIRWSNENKDNVGSSWHCTVLQGLHEAAKVLLVRYPLVEKYLPATAVLHADIKHGTWHGNWTNSKTFGLENTNLGRFKSVDLDDLICVSYHDSKSYKRTHKPMLIRTQWWDAFPREQLVSNINIGRMLRAMQGDSFLKSWVIPHHAFWASKHDTGSAYPIHNVREAIFNDQSIESMKWLNNYEEAVTVKYLDEDDKPDYLYLDVERDLDARAVTVVGDDVVVKEYVPQMRVDLDRLGLYVEPNGSEDLDNLTRLAVRIFQQSTAAWKKVNPNWVLDVDGVPGPQTRKALDRRLIFFGFSVE